MDANQIAEYRAGVKRGQYIDLDLWFDRYRTYLYRLLEPMIPDDPELVQDLVNQEAMNIWTRGMISDLFDPQYNYQTYEKLGDSVLELAFNEYLFRRNPKITESEISEYKNYYLSKIFLSDLARNIGLDKFLLVTPTRDKRQTDPTIGDIRASNYIDLQEDAFEAFMGAMFLVGNEVGNLGYNLAYNFVRKIFDDIELDVEITKGSFKTQVQQLVRGLSGENFAKNEDQNPDGSWTISVVLPPNAHRLILDNFGKQIRQSRLTTDPVIAERTEQSKKNADNQVYKDAYAYFEAIGFNKEWLKQFNHSKTFRNPLVAQFYQPVEEKRRRDGYRELNIFKPVETAVGNSVLIQLRAVLPDNTIIPLYTMKVFKIPKGKVPENKKQAKAMEDEQIEMAEKKLWEWYLDN